LNGSRCFAVGLDDGERGIEVVVEMGVGKIQHRRWIVLHELRPNTLHRLGKQLRPQHARPSELHESFFSKPMDLLSKVAVAYLAQHLIVLLDPADIVANLHHAYRQPEFRDRHYAALHSGPSATADIEGVLIHGAQGVRSLSVVPIERTGSDTAG
jgi:hypothetical protein